MPKENGKIRSEYLLAALMCIAVAFFLTILIVSKSCSADLPEEGNSSDVTSPELSSEPPVSSTPSVQPVKVENVTLGSPAKVTEGILASGSGTGGTGKSPDGENLVNMYSESKSYYSGSESSIPYGHSGTRLELRKEALYALNAMVEAFNSSVGGKTNLIVQSAYLGSGSSDSGEAIDGNLATGCAVLFSVYPADPAGDYLGSGKFTWLESNCRYYGYILRYPEEKADFTHQSGNSRLYRFVGYEHAAYMGEYHLTMEEYFDTLRGRTSDNPLTITCKDSKGNERNCEIYFVPVVGGEVGELPIRGGEGTEFTYTGNGVDGIIVTCYTD